MTGCSTSRWLVVAVALLVAAIFAMPEGTNAQVSTGSIEGIVTDPVGAVIPGATVSITEGRTGRVLMTTTGGGGKYFFSALQPGRFEVKVEAPGFKAAVRQVVVKVGEVVPGDVSLEVGSPTEVVTVEAEAEVQVNTTTATVEGVVVARQIDELPLNGRNFLDLAQLEPGVQIVDGGTFDPTKNQFTGISIGGRTGRVTRIQIDGLDISDETVGTTTQNISQDALQEFQLSQSTLDLSTSLTSSGSVNIITRSGSNEFHGRGFVFYRDEEIAANPSTLTGDPTIDAQLKGAEFDREQAGFRFGGPFIPDRLFFFANFEKTNQDGTTFTRPTNFPNFSRAVSTPFNENEGLFRLDWQVTDRLRLFGRFTHDSNDAATGFGGAATCCAPFVNDNNTNVIAIGADATTGQMTHSFRYGRTSFDNQIVPATLGLPEFFASNGVPVSIALNGRRELFTGPNRLAPQMTFQTDDQWKYDLTYTRGSHTIRSGAEVKYTRVNLFASFFGVGPEVRGSFSQDIREQIIARGDDPLDPLQYPISFIIFGNGQGSFTEIANNERSMGGINNTRYAWYVGDSWRARPNLTINYGVRYELDTGQVNDDLPGARDLEFLVGRGQSRPTRSDHNNFGPQLGIAWDPFGTGKTVIRGGAGIFYETQIFNNAIFDRTDRLPVGLGFAVAVPPFDSLDEQGRLLAANGQPVSTINVNDLLGRPLGEVIDEIGLLQQLFQQVSRSIPLDPSAPSLLEASKTTAAGPIFNQEFSTPYAFQVNVGVQQEIRPGVVVSVDYIRNRAVHTNVVRDFNRTFAADTLNAATAAALRDAQLMAAGFAPGLAGVDQAIAAGESFGLFSGLGNAFAGEFPDYSDIDVILTSGISEYNALQFQLTGNFTNPAPYVKSLFLQVSYALSRFNAIVGDQDFITGTAFNDDFLNPRAKGPSALDRTHQLTINSIIELPHGFTLASIWRVNTARPTTPLLPQFGRAGSANEIFFTDLDGDGTTSDILPGAERGSFGRDIQDGGELNERLTVFNSSFAGTLTPAARALVQAGVFTADQLRALGFVIQPIPLAPSNQVENDSFITTDLRISKKTFLYGERIDIEPFVEVFNVFNVANFGQLSGILGGSPGQINGTVRGTRSNKLGLGSGSFSQGLSRAVQVGLSISF